MKKTQQGFTLIELMIVVAIIGILAAVALPAYQDYVAKSKITSIVATASSGKSAMFDRYQELGHMPEDGAAAGQIAEVGSTTEGFYNIMEKIAYSKGDTVNKYEKTDDATGTFTITLDKINAAVNGKTLAFAFADTGGKLEMKCTPEAGLAAKYLPAQCK